MTELLMKISSGSVLDLLKRCSFIWVCLLVLMTAGCGVRQKVIVTSDPPGADITMNALHLGKTPTEAPFTWYWYYDFKAENPGYETEVRRERFRAPVYLWPGIDLAMEMMPFHVRDTKKVHFDLRTTEELPDPIYSTVSDAGL